MTLSTFVVQSLFAFFVLMMPAVVLAPPGENAKYTVSDFFGYYVQARLLAEGRFSDSFVISKMEQAVYDVYPSCKSVDRHNFLSLGTPEPIIFLLPIVLVPPPEAYVVGVFGIVVAISLSIPLLADVFALSEKQFKFAVPCVALSGPVWEVVRVTKPTAFILLGLALAMWFLKSTAFKNSKYKNLWAALSLQAWTFKPHEIIPLLAMCFGARQFKFVGWLLAITILIMLITLPIMGVDAYTNWYDTLKINLAHPEFAAPQSQPNLRGQLLRFDIGQIQAINHYCTLLYVFSMLGLTILGSFFRDNKSYLLLLVLCLPIGFITSLHSLTYDLVLLIPGCFAFINYPFLKMLSKTLRWGAYVIFGACLLVFELPFYTIIHYNYVLTNKWVINPLFVSLSLLGTLFLTLVIANVVHANRQHSASLERAES